MLNSTTYKLETIRKTMLEKCKAHPSSRYESTFQYYMWLLSGAYKRIGQLSPVWFFLSVHGYNAEAYQNCIYGNIGTPRKNFNRCARLYLDVRTRRGFEVNCSPTRTVIY